MSYQTIALWARIVLETAIKCLSAQVVATQMQITNQFARHAKVRASENYYGVDKTEYTV